MKRVSLFLHGELGCLFPDRPAVDSGYVRICASVCAFSVHARVCACVCSVLGTETGRHDSDE